MGTAWLIATACIFIFTAAGLYTDLTTRRLPNVLTVPAFCAGLLFHAVNGFCKGGLSGTGQDLLFSLGGFGAGFGLILILWLIGGSGGGDVKFTGALGAWLGAWLTIQVLVLSAVLSGMLTGALLLKKVFGLKKLRTVETDAQRRRKAKKEATAKSRPLWGRNGWVVPFGVTAALATWIVLAVEWSGKGLPWPPM